MTRLALLIALLLALPASASAQTLTDYEVTIAGTADYNRADVDGDVTAQHDIALDFKTVIPQLRFVGDAVEDSRGARGYANITRGHYVIRGEGGQITCTDHSIADVDGGGLDATHGAQGITFATRVIDAFKVNATCGSSVPPWSMDFGSDGQEVGIGIFDGAFSMPYSRVGEETMTFPLKGEVTGSSCPFNHFNTVLCSMTWEATVTFKRTNMDVVPVPIVDDPVDEEELFVPLVAKARLAKNLSGASLPVTCASSCAGTLSAAAGGKALARKAFEAGKATTVKLRFDAADRRAIERAGKVKLTVRSGGLKRAVVLRAG